MSSLITAGKRSLEASSGECNVEGVKRRKRRKVKPKEHVEDAGKSADKAKSSPLSVAVAITDMGFLDVYKSCHWKDIVAENLCLQYAQFYNVDEADTLLSWCDRELVYNTGDLATVKLFGKRISIPRKQVAHGDTGLTYSFSGNTVPARPWIPFLSKIRDQISQATGLEFNFVLVNRYKNGHDYMGEHKDDERDLTPGYPIASLTLGQARDFVFRHQDARGKHAKRKIDPVTMVLEHGMLLLMKHPTNSFWYHSLPRRTKALGVRVNMTFRNMQPSVCKPALVENL